MTCKEFRSYLTSGSHANREAQPQPSALEHMARCEDCARVFQEERQTRASLRLVRDAAPLPPASLDAAVLADFRARGTAAKDHEVSHSVFFRRPLAAFGWTAAVAAGLLLVAFWLVRPHAATLATNTLTPRAPAVSRPQMLPPTTDKQATPSASRVAKHSIGTPRAAPVQRAQSAAAVNVESDFQHGFKSLMYCDALSCAGTLDVVRIQLPASAEEWMASSRQSDGVVYADVLVGPDGIARGIRIVQ